MPTVPKSPPSSQATPPDPLPGIIDFATVNLLAGASGVGKTCLTAWLVTRFRDTLPIFGHLPSPIPKIAYLCADRSWAQSRVWLERAGYGDIAAYSLINDLDVEPGRLEQKRQLIPILREAIAKLDPLPPGSLLIIDPIGLFLGGNLNDYYGCAVALIRIRRLCLERQITIVGLAHASKQKGDSKERYSRLQDRIAGSMAQLGFGDTQMYLASPEETGKPYYTFLWHPHTSPAKEFYLGRDPDTGLFVPWEGETVGLSLHAYTAPEAQKILARIPDTEEGITFADLVTGCGEAEEGSRATVHRYLQHFLSTGQVLKIGHGRYRTPPPS